MLSEFQNGLYSKMVNVAMAAAHLHRVYYIKLVSYSSISDALILQDVKLHFLAYHKKQVSWPDLCALVNTWHLMTLFACLLIEASTVMKIIGDYKVCIV